MSYTALTSPNNHTIYCNTIVPSVSVASDTVNCLFCNVNVALDATSIVSDVLFVTDSANGATGSQGALQIQNGGMYVKKDIFCDGNIYATNFSGGGSTNQYICCLSSGASGSYGVTAGTPTPFEVMQNITSTEIGGFNNDLANMADDANFSIIIQKTGIYKLYACFVDFSTAPTQDTVDTFTFAINGSIPTNAPLLGVQDGSLEIGGKSPARYQGEWTTPLTIGDIVTLQISINYGNPSTFGGQGANKSTQLLVQLLS